MLDYPIKPFHKQDIKHIEYMIQSKLDDLFGWQSPDRDKAMEAGYIKGMLRVLDDLGYEVKITPILVRDKYHREEVDKKK